MKNASVFDGPFDGLSRLAVGKGGRVNARDCGVTQGLEELWLKRGCVAAEIVQHGAVGEEGRASGAAAIRYGIRGRNGVRLLNRHVRIRGRASRETWKQCGIADEDLGMTKWAQGLGRGAADLSIRLSVEKLDNERGRRELRRIDQADVAAEIAVVSETGDEHLVESGAC